MKKNVQIMILVAMMAALSFSSCTKKLDLLPTNDITAETVYSTAAGYKQSLAKVYARYF